VKSSDTTPDYVLINGDVFGNQFQQRLTLSNGKDANSISKLWARRKLQELYNAERTLSYGGHQANTVSGSKPVSLEQLKTDITQLALNHQLMSKYTSFVAVEEKVSRPLDQMLQKHLEANAMPTGNTMAIPVPAGALGLAGLWQMGLLSLLGLLIINWRRLPVPSRLRINP